jgi:hypothetical protein
MTVLTLASYSDLLAFAAVTLNRTDLTDYLPAWVTMAEGQITDRLISEGPVRQMMGRSDATIDSEYIAVPDDFEGARAIYLDPNYLPLDFISPEEIVQRKTLYPNEPGDPQAFTVVGEELQFWPWNDGSFTGEMTYWKRIPALTSINTSNWLLERRPDVYLYTTLIQSAPFLKNDDRLAVWGGLAETGIADMVKSAKSSRSAPHLSVGIVAGGTP